MTKLSMVNRPLERSILNLFERVPAMLTEISLIEMDMVDQGVKCLGIVLCSFSRLFPFVIELCDVVRTDSDNLGHKGYGDMHQPTVAVVEEVFQSHAIGIAEGDGLVALSVLLRPYHETERARLYLCLVEHPTIEEQVFVAA